MSWARLTGEIAQARGPALAPGAQLEWDLTHGVGGDAGGFWRLVRFDAEHEWDRLENERELDQIREENRKRERVARARLLPPPGPGRLSLPEALDRLERVRKAPKGWMARCPVHEDAIPSLAVCESDDRPGEPVFHCFAGCHWTAVRDALR